MNNQQMRDFTVSNGPLKLVLVAAAIAMFALAPKGQETATPAPVEPPKTLFELHQADAAMKCQPEIERRAAYDFRWPGGWIGGVHFTKWREYNGKIDFAGDNLEFQNGIGNWMRMNYVCEYDPATKKITKITILSGRLP